MVYSYPSRDSAAFIEDMNTELAPALQVVEIEGLLCPTFKVEGTETLSSITRDSIRRLGSKHFRAQATFADNLFWFLAQI